MENSSSHVPKGMMQPGQRPQFANLRGPPGGLQPQALVGVQHQRPMQSALQPGQQSQHSSMVQSPHQAVPQGQPMVQQHPSMFPTSGRPMYTPSQQTGYHHHLQHQPVSSPRAVSLPVNGPGQSGAHPSMMAMQSSQQPLPGQLPPSQQAVMQVRGFEFWIAVWQALLPI